MKTKSRFPVLLGISLSIIFPQVAFPETAAVGKTAPDFTLSDTYGNPHALSNYKGKYIVLEWVNHDCPFVRKHYDSGNMQNLQRYASEHEVVWLSIGSSAPGKQGHFPSEKWNVLTEEKGARPTAVLLDPDGAVGRTYGAQTTPHMYVIDPQGMLVYQGAIDNIASTDPEDASRANNYVKACLNECFSGNTVTNPSTKAYGCSVKY